MTSTIPRGFYVAGTWAETAGVRQIACPADGGPVGAVAECTGDDAAAAVLAARTTFDDGRWSQLPAHERAGLLARVADLLERDRAVYAKAEALDTGVPLRRVAAAPVEAAACFRTGAPEEPVGVQVLLTSWYSPLLQVARALAPTLAAGDSVVLKPSQRTPSTAILLMDTLAEAGLPAGVVNLVTGTGAEVGSVLTAHPAVDAVQFTGRRATGTAVASAAAANGKRVVLELRARTSVVVGADDDREAALDGALAALLEPGPAATRLLVHEDIAEEVTGTLVGRAAAVRAGGPFDDAELGPLISTAHRDRLHELVQAAVAAGARVRCGGSVPTRPPLDAGSFYPPTVVDRCAEGLALVEQDLTGPVLTVETFAGDAAALRARSRGGDGVAEPGPRQPVV